MSIWSHLKIESLMNNSENLTLQQQRFCDEYLVSFNAYSAAVCAGYSMNTARKAELLHLPKIQAYLKAGMAKNAERLQVSHDMILRELAKIAFSNMGNYYDDNATLKPMSLLTTDEKAAISQYQIMDSLDQDGNRVGEFSRIKLHNKMSALDKIARHVGFYGVNQTQESGCKNQEVLNESEESGGLKQDALNQNQESRGKNEDEESLRLADCELLMVNDEGKLVNELIADEAAAPGDLTDALVNTSAGTEKILTISPRYRKALAGGPSVNHL
jgi:phage terminase small subunit